MTNKDLIEDAAPRLIRFISSQCTQCSWDGVCWTSDPEEYKLRALRAPTDLRVTEFTTPHSVAKANAHKRVAVTQPRAGKTYLTWARAGKTRDRIGAQGVTRPKMEGGVNYLHMQVVDAMYPGVIRCTDGSGKAGRPEEVTDGPDDD